MIVDATQPPKDSYFAVSLSVSTSFLSASTLYSESYSTYLCPRWLPLGGAKDVLLGSKDGLEVCTSAEDVPLKMKCILEHSLLQQKRFYEALRSHVLLKIDLVRASLLFIYVA